MLREHQAKGTCLATQRADGSLSDLWRSGSHTFGALDTVQVPWAGEQGRVWVPPRVRAWGQVVQMAKYLTSAPALGTPLRSVDLNAHAEVYVSGWQSSSTASTSNEPGLGLTDRIR